MDNAITVKDLSMRFGDVEALKGINVTFEAHRIYGLLGRNGAGKTTLLNLISNRLFPSEGTLELNGTRLTENDAAQREIFFVGERQLLPEETRVRDYFAITKIFYPGFDTGYANILAHRYALPLNKRLRALSTGYATIAKLIAALATDAKYLLLDEPVLGLDANHREQFYRDLLENYGKNPRTIIISTHLIEEVSSIIEQVVIIKNGAILLDKPAEEVKEMGYSVSGKADEVDAYCKGKNVLSMDTLGGLKTACLLGKAEHTPDSLAVTSLDMQKLFVHLTNQ